MLMYGCDLRSAIRLAEDCRVRITAIDTTETGHRFQVAASFGITSTALSGYTLERLLSDADRMLYQSKEHGRNQVSAFPAEDPEAGPGPLEPVPWPEAIRDLPTAQPKRSLGHVG
jgi:hypothetical protein